MILQRAVHADLLGNVIVPAVVDRLGLHHAPRLEQVHLLVREDHAADAVAVAGGHLDEAAAQAAGGDALEHADAVAEPVDKEIVQPDQAGHGVHRAAGDDVGVRGLRLVGGQVAVQLHLLLVHPDLKLRERDGVVRADALEALGLLLAGDAGADVDDGRAGTALAQNLRVRLRGRDDRREIGQRLGEVLFAVEHDRRAAGGDDRRVLRLAREHLELALHKLRALGGLIGVGEAHLPERLAQTLKTVQAEIRQIGAVHARDHGLSALDQALDRGDLADVLLGVARADRDALAAEDTVARDDLRHALEHAHRLDRTVADALVAIDAFIGAEA